MVAFTAHLDTASYPTTYYAVVDTTLNKAKTGTLVSTTILADALLVRRWTVASFFLKFNIIR